jgi:lipopolysaccharide/colanic/teichoic acid biosynthesis glycosyltransferase
MLLRRIRFVLIGVDVAAVPVALFLAYLFRYGHKVGAHLAHPTPWAAINVVVVGAIVPWLVLCKPMSLDSFSEGWSLPATVSRIALGGAIQMGVILALAYMSRVYFSRLILAYFAVTFCGLVLLARIIAYKLLRRYHRIGRTRRVVIVGEGRVARELVRRIRRHPELLYEVVGLLNPWTRPGNAHNNQSPNGEGELSSLDALKVLKRKGVYELIVCMDQPPVAEVESFLARCLDQGIRVSLVPQSYELYSSRARLVELAGVPLVALEGLPDFRVAAVIKRATDLILGLPLLLLALPILAVSSVVLRLQGRGLLRRELRGGWHGEPFWMYRLDVDRHAAHATTFQRFLCWLSISELPQLFNVLFGQMSLVGPRPESLEQVRDYSAWQQRRLNIKPGITGLAQVNGLREQHSSEEKARYDLQYMVHWTPMADLVLLLQTLWTLAARLWASSEPRSLRPSEGGPPGSVVSQPAPFPEFGTGK